MITLKDIQVEGSRFEQSLVSLIGKPIKDIYGYIDDLGGGATFKLTSIVFEDGTRLGVEGEHDFPYAVEYGRDTQPNFDEETLERLLEEDE